MSSDMRCGLLGKTLGHSLSPYLHSLLGDPDYRLFEVPEDGVADFINGGEWDALNVTIPYKKTVIPFCDSLSDRAQSVGAVNTLVRRDGRIYGDNTDFAGFCDMASGISFAGKKVAVLGSGGASATVQAAARFMGAREITVVSRSGNCRYENKEVYSDADILVNTTPVGMYPDADGAPLEPGIFTNLSAVLDLIYNPLRTRLVLEAQKLGIEARGGLRMLCTQAHEARRIFTGNEPELSADSLFSTVLRRKENIVFVGMPGCGKSTFARMIADRYKKTLFDTDSVIAERAGMTIPEIFEKYGEAHFRALEKEAVTEASLEMGAVIATGGGSVLDPDNRRMLRSNSFVIYLDCPVENLATAGRPLSSSQDKVRRLYRERAGIYREVSDAKIDVTQDNSRNIARIIGVTEHRYRGAV